MTHPLSYAAAAQRFRNIIEDITKERAAQDQKWGEQNHAFAHYNAILIEEVGEMSKAYLECDMDGLRTEMVQAAAVLVAMIEAFDRRPMSFSCRHGMQQVPKKPREYFEDLDGRIL